MLTADVTTRLKELGTATLHEARGQLGALDHGIKPLDPKLRLAGTALTVDAAPGDNLVIHYALTQAVPGDVLIVDAKGHVGAGLWGDILTLAAQQCGVHGLVTDGAVRDVETIVEMGFPVFARGVCIQAARKSEPGRVNVPVTCGGVRVDPGDIIVGDCDGVVVIPKLELDATLRSARERVEAECRLRAAILAGALTVDLLGLRPAIARLHMVSGEPDRSR